PVEAQACGTPVIAYGKGGALETVRPIGINNPTGLFFDRQEISSVCDAVKQFEQNIASFLPVDCRQQALTFSEARFRKELSSYVNDKWFLFQESKRGIINK